MVSTVARGQAAEQLAAEYLQRHHGYQIDQINYRALRGEIDIVARDPQGVLVFVEVKTARDLRYGHPLFRINRTKQRTLHVMARIYLDRASHSGPCRFDAIAIVGGKLEHLKNAFLA